MAIKSTRTPKNRIRAALRQLFLKSRERAAAVKRDQYTCQICGAKQSKAKGREVKVQCHHKEGYIPNWDLLIEEIYKHLLCDIDKLTTLCKICHDIEHKTVKQLKHRRVKLKVRRKKKRFNDGGELKPCGWYLLREQTKLKVRRNKK